MPAQISEKTAEEVITAVSKMCDYIDAGMEPNAAGEKVANELGLSCGQIELACRSYNNGAVNAARSDGNTFAEKFAVLKLVDPETINQRTFPSTAKAASETIPVAAVYSSHKPAPVAVKVAAEATAEPYKVARCGCGCDRKAGECRYAKETKYSAAKRKMAELTDLQNNLRKLEWDVTRKVAAVHDTYRERYGNQTDRLQWLRKTAGELFGETGRLLIDRTAAKLLGPVMLEKYASACRESILGKQPEPIDRNQGVFGAIKLAIESMEKLVDAQNALPRQAIEIHREARYIAEGSKHANTILPKGVTPKQADDLVWTKNSSILSSVIGSTIASGAKGSPADNSVGLVQARLQLNDPSHQRELRRLRAEFLINELMQRDDIIRSYTPEEVAYAYEDLGQSSPSIVTNPALLQANMRRQLQGNLTPSEAKDLVSTGQSIAPTALPSVAGMTLPASSSNPAQAKKDPSARPKN